VLPRWHQLLNGDEAVALPWVVLCGFLRLTTNPRVFPQCLTPEAAWAFVDEWLDLDITTIPLEKSTHRTVLKLFIEESGTAGNLVTDAHIASIALTHDAVVLSCDRDFLSDKCHCRTSNILHLNV